MLEYGKLILGVAGALE